MQQRTRGEQQQVSSADGRHSSAAPLHSVPRMTANATAKAQTNAKHANAQRKAKQTTTGEMMPPSRHKASLAGLERMGLTSSPVACSHSPTPTRTLDMCILH